MKTSLIALDAIRVLDSTSDFEAAITEAAELLVITGCAHADYVSAVLENYRTLGPYFVVAPEVAIAHAKPGPDVVSPAISLLKLNNSVASGHSMHKSVKLVFALATPSADAHIDLMGELASRLSSPETMNSLLNASAKSVIWEILNG